MHEERFVEYVPVELTIFRFLNRNLRSLRQTGEQFMNGVCGKHHGIGTARTIFTDGMHVFVIVVEGRMRNPGLIEMQGVNFGPHLFFDHFHVVAHTVVCALRNGKNARALVLHMTRERIGFNFGANRLGVEFLLGNRTNNAQMVTRGAQKHRNGARHDNGVKNRLMTVAVDHHNIVVRHVGMPDDFVRR